MFQNGNPRGGDTILAGYPFFEDWGRDTMIALPGICISTGQFETAKRILRTFAQNERDGLMPNLTTNLTQTECYRLSLMAPKAVTYDIIQNSIPLEGTYKDATIRKMAVLEVDFEANKKFLQENLYGDGDITSTSEASAE